MPAAPDGSGEVDKSAETGAGAPTSWDIDDTWARTDSKAAGGALGTEPMVAWILAHLGEHGGQAVDVGHSRACAGPGRFAMAAATAGDQLVDLFGFFALSGGGVFLALAFVQLLQHRHRTSGDEVDLHGRCHGRLGVPHRSARPDQRLGRQFGALAVDQESGTVVGQDVFVMGAATALGHFGRCHLQVRLQEVGARARSPGPGVPAGPSRG